MGAGHWVMAMVGLLKGRENEKSQAVLKLAAMNAGGISLLTVTAVVVYFLLMRYAS